MLSQAQEVQAISAPLTSRVLLILCLLFGVSSSVIVISVYEYFTPTYSNQFGLLVSLLCHLGIVIGPGALYGLRLANFTLYPRKQFQTLI
jgi:hypothetical protein